MPFTYDKLWDKLKNKKITKDALRLSCGISPNTIVSMSQNNPVSLDVIDRICAFFKCDPMDILTYIPVISEEEIKQGDIWWADLSAIIGAEQGGLRPVVILKVDEDTVIGAPVTTKVKKVKSSNIVLDTETSGLPKYSTALLDHIRVIDKSRLTEKSGEVDPSLLNKETKSFFATLFGL